MMDEKKEKRKERRREGSREEERKGERGGVWLNHIQGQFLQKMCKLLIPPGTSTEYQKGTSLFLLNEVFTLSC